MGSRSPISRECSLIDRLFNIELEHVLPPGPTLGPGHAPTIERFAIGQGACGIEDP